MITKKAKQLVDKAPHCLVLHQVVAEYAGRLIDIAITGAPRQEVLNQDSDGRVDSDETASMAPVYRVEVGIHLQ
jgi:hypothetical protein